MFLGFVLRAGLPRRIMKIRLRVPACAASPNTKMTAPVNLSVFCLSMYVCTPSHGVVTESYRPRKSGEKCGLVFCLTYYLDYYGATGMPTTIELVDSLEIYAAGNRGIVKGPEWFSEIGRFRLRRTPDGWRCRSGAVTLLLAGGDLSGASKYHHECAIRIRKMVSRAAKDDQTPSSLAEFLDKADSR